MSATKASINRSFCRRENLGDLTAKSGSQATAAGLVGTALGVAIGGAVDASVATLLVAFVPLSAASLWGNYRSLLYAATPTLNVERTCRMLQPALAVRGGRLRLEPERIQTPRQVSAVERFMRQTRHVASEGRLPGIAVAPSLRRTVAGAAAALDMARTAFGPRGCAQGERYYLGFLPPPTAAAAAAGPGRLHLWFDAQATGADMLLGFYHAMACRALLGCNGAAAADAQAQSYLFAKQTFAALHQTVVDCGWETDTLYLAKRSALVARERQD
ncbi:hypothetical protein IWQ56_005469 [Coemansia nantahalensis]|nr:hypothetical protein IWQ56_005469 [Coemansia nantahalensis]